MATRETVMPSAEGARVVGNCFVEQYYQILHHSPNLVHRFYKESSLLSRPDGNGNMTTVTTSKAINDKILSLNYEDFTVEIKTADAQESNGRGVIVVVTGCLTGKNAVKRNFTQTFFLAPQKNGYFVLNDVFRYVEENSEVPTNNIVEDVSANAASDAALPAEPEHSSGPSWEEQARLFHEATSSYNTFCSYPPEVVRKMSKKELEEEVWRLQAALGEQTEITKFSQQEYERLQTDKVLCRICFEGEISIVLLPCRHRILCSTCSEKCKECPICRKPVEERLPVYDA